MLSAHEKLKAHIVQAVEKNSGWLNFATFMQMALYEPGLGYYSAGLCKLGAGGDFVTAPEISPLFSEGIAAQCVRVFERVSHPMILELGAGTGLMACDILHALEKINALPEKYFILEISGDLRDRQQSLLKKQCPHLMDRVNWLNELPPQKISGIILANEVLDAMPVHLFEIKNKKIYERGVTVKNNIFCFASRLSSDDFLVQAVSRLGELPEGYQSEIHLHLPAYLNSLSDVLYEGMMLFVDYGASEREYYHPDRSSGTLLCHYQQRVYDNPLERVGLQDITAHVNFTQVALAAMQAGLTVSGYTTQASFLLSAGVMQKRSDISLSEVARYRRNQAIKMLVMPHQMGERFKVIGLTKAIACDLYGNDFQDLRHLL